MRIFRSLDELLENLRGYGLTDITPSLSNSNASDFVNIDAMPSILEALPTPYIPSFFSKVRGLEKTLSKDNLLGLLASDAIPHDKKWSFFHAVAPRVCVGMRHEDINVLRNLFPESEHALKDIQLYPSFSITSPDEALGLLEFFICVDQRMEVVYKKIRAANSDALIAGINLPGAPERIIAAVAGGEQKRQVASFLYRKLTPVRFLDEAVRNESNFDCFLDVFRHLRLNAKRELMNGLLEPQRLANLTPDMRAQFASFMSHNVGVDNLVSEDSLACHLYDNSLLTDAHFFLYCSSLRESAQYSQQLLELSDAKKLELFAYAITWLENIRPSREEMKRYQEYQASCYALMVMAGDVLVAFTGAKEDGDDIDCRVMCCAAPIFPLVLAIAAIMAIIGLIPAITGLCLESQKIQAEQAFQRAVGLNGDNVTINDSDTVYQNSFSFWTEERTKNYFRSIRESRDLTQPPEQAVTPASSSLS